MKKIRFRGGPKHNKSNIFEELRNTIILIEYEPLYNQAIWDNTQNYDLTTKYIQHKYQLGKDKNGKQFYFYIGI